MASWLITLLIIAVNGFFVAAEFALVKVRGSQIDVLIKQGNSRASLIKHIIEHLDNYLSACQLGITIASLGLGWVAEPLIASQFFKLDAVMHRNLEPTTIHSIAIPMTFLFITTLHIVLGEQAPKSFAIRDPLITAQRISLPLYWFYKIFKPFIRFLNSLSLGVLKLFGVTSINEEQSHSEAELRMIVAESEEDGQINASERELIQNVFDFDNRQVGEIMTPSHKIFALDAKDWNHESIQESIQEGFSRIPVFEDAIDNIIGWILLKDLMAQYIQQKTSHLGELLRPIQYVPESMHIDDCLRLLQKSHIHIAVVTNEYGNIIGLITMEDILEELVGDIHDEGDETLSIVTHIKEGTYIIDASASIHDINEELPVGLPEDENYDTMAGYVNTVFGCIPNPQDSIDTEHYRITITKREKQRVEQVKLELKTTEK